MALEKAKALLTLTGLSRKWQVAVYVFVGAAVGMGLLVARIANAASYLSNEPDTCMNCHVMTDAYATWQRGSHARAAVCNDCHVPHTNVVAEYTFKAGDGIKHSYVFTLGIEPQVLRLSRHAVPVVRENCVKCHADQLVMIRLADSAERKCWDCHDNIHGSVMSLSASPDVLRPQLPDAGLDWLKTGEEQ